MQPPKWPSWEAWLWWVVVRSRETGEGHTEGQTAQLVVRILSIYKDVQIPERQGTPDTQRGMLYGWL